MTNPFYDPYKVLGKVYAEGAHLKIALSDSGIEELNRARTVKTVYGVLENDGYLSECIRAFAPKTPKQSARVLIKISLYWLLFLHKPRYMVTDTAVDLCKKLGKSGMAGFINAFLRKFEAEKVRLPEGDRGLSLRYNFPLFAVGKLKEQYGARAEAVMGAKSHGVTVRFVRGEDKYLSRPHETTPFEHVYIFPNFARDEGFYAGDYTFQSVGSIAICSVIDPCRRLLDACAAPGGKSVLLAPRCGKIVASELHAHRVSLIEAYCSRMGAENVTPVQADSRIFREEWEGAFDGVLCDVPCSGLGTVAENPDLPLRKTEEDFRELQTTQLAILNNCSRYVTGGGMLYYSTCSILKEENDCIIQAFLDTNQSFEPVRSHCALPHETTKYGMQFLPDTAFGAGFYVCKLRKTV